METIRIPLTQFLMPDGRTKDTWCDDMPGDLAPQMDAITAHGCRLTCEVLSTGEISLAIEHEDGDFDLELAENGPGDKSPKKSLERLIRRFDADAFEKWLKYGDNDERHQTGCICADCSGAELTSDND